MNPWSENLLSKCRSVFRFVLWACFAVNGPMVSFFSIIFTYQFLKHLWSWCERVLFPGQW